MQRVITAILHTVTEGLKEKQTLPECRRLFHGRGQCFERLEYINVDWYYPVIFVTLYREIDTPSWEQLLTGINLLNNGSNSLLVQRRYLPRAPIELIWGPVVDHAVASEKGMTFGLTFATKQNIGFFLDMSPGRQWLLQLANNKRVLNLFSYTCSLSVAAIAGGASYVVNVDMSRAALRQGRKNHSLNGHDLALKRNIQFMPYEIFRSWKAIIHKGPYDIVVVDPPSRQKGSFIADKDYARVVRRLAALLPVGGDILLCLNAPELGEEFLETLMQMYCPQAKKIQRLANRDDFPETNSQRNVKMLHYYLPENGEAIDAK